MAADSRQSECDCEAESRRFPRGGSHQSIGYWAGVFRHGGAKRDYIFLPVVIDDKPGQLAKLFEECAAVEVSVEDLTIEHSPGQETGLITLALNANQAKALELHLKNAGWRVHPPRLEK